MATATLVRHCVTAEFYMEAQKPFNRRLHDLILCQTAMSISFHPVAPDVVDVFDKAQIERTAAVLIALEFSNGGFSSIGAIKPNDTTTLGPTAWLVLNFGLFHFPNGCKKIYKIIVTRRPRQLSRD